MPPDAQTPEALIAVERSSGGFGGSTAYPCRYGRGSRYPWGSEVARSPSGRYTISSSNCS